MQMKWNEIQHMYRSQKLYSLLSAHLAFPICTLLARTSSTYLSWLRTPWNRWHKLSTRRENQVPWETRNDWTEDLRRTGRLCSTRFRSASVGSLLPFSFLLNVSPAQRYCCEPPVLPHTRHSDVRTPLLCSLVAVLIQMEYLPPILHLPPFIVLGRPFLYYKNNVRSNLLGGEWVRLLTSNLSPCRARFMAFV